MSKEELFREIEIICMVVFKYECNKSEGIKGYSGKMRTYAHTAFIVAVHGLGIRLQSISDYLACSLSNTTRLRLAYKARLQKDGTFSTLMTDFNEKLRAWEKKNTIKKKNTHKDER